MKITSFAVDSSRSRKFFVVCFSVWFLTDADDSTTDAKQIQVQLLMPTRARRASHLARANWQNFCAG
jgi:hypothetical protein